MKTFEDFIQELALLGISKHVAKKTVRALKKCGLTKQDIEKFDGYSLKLVWLLALKTYVRFNCTMPEIVSKALNISIAQVQDLKLALEMQGFVAAPSYEKAEHLYHEVAKSIQEDIVKDFFELVDKLETNAKELKIQIGI